MDHSEKLSKSLRSLAALQAEGRRVFRSDELGRVDRERLLKAGFLSPIMRGWVVSTSPTAVKGDTTPFYTTFWEFCAVYCKFRFGKEWHLSAETAIFVHAENKQVQNQIVINAVKGSNNLTELAHGTSIYDLKAKMPPLEDLTEVDGLRVYTPEVALIRVAPDFFQRNPTEVQTVLMSLRSVSPLLQKLIEGGHTLAAGRLAGALRRIGRNADADRILKSMRDASFDVREVDPFAPNLHLAQSKRAVAPITARLTAFWQRHREAVLEIMPKAPGRPDNPESYIASIDEIYKQDAYHSLSIEGYVVTEDLIEQVRSGKWDPTDQNKQDRDAMAARGYHETFEMVRENVHQVMTGANPAGVWEGEFQNWYQGLFKASAKAGLIDFARLAGFRNNPVYIQGSKHVPPRMESVSDGMEAIADLMREEPEASVRAVLGHWLFGYVHPFPDGNGRLARFTMNLMLASGGYPWTIIKVEERNRYMGALEAASVGEDIRPFAGLIADSINTN